VKLNRDAERYIKFQRNQDATSAEKYESSNTKDEIRDLGHIKDIRDGLGIMLYSRTCQPAAPSDLFIRFRNLGGSPEHTGLATSLMSTPLTDVILMQKKEH